MIVEFIKQNKILIGNFVEDVSVQTNLVGILNSSNLNDFLQEAFNPVADMIKDLKLNVDEEMCSYLQPVIADEYKIETVRTMILNMSNETLTSLVNISSSSLNDFLQEIGDPIADMLKDLNIDKETLCCVPQLNINNKYMILDIIPSETLISIKDFLINPSPTGDVPATYIMFLAYCFFMMNKTGGGNGFSPLLITDSFDLFLDFDKIIDNVEENIANVNEERSEEDNSKKTSFFSSVNWRSIAKKGGILLVMSTAVAYSGNYQLGTFAGLGAKILESKINNSVDT